MKEVEKKDEKEIEKPDIPDASGGLSYPDDGCFPIPIGPGFPFPDPGYPERDFPNHVEALTGFE